MPQSKKIRIEKRHNRRVAIARPMRVRPSGPKDPPFEDTPISVNASRRGLYFTTRRRSYYPGMHLLLTFPFIAINDPLNCDYLGKVARVGILPSGRFGIGVQLLISLTSGTAAQSASPKIA